MDRLTTKDIVTAGLLTATLEAAKISLAGLASIELVSTLIIVFTLIYQKKVFPIIYTFVFLEGFLYGFGMWWFAYLYIWPLLAAVTLLFKTVRSPWFWAVFSGIYGLLFGGLTALPYFLLGGVHSGLAYWIAGIPFDITHCIGNFGLTLLLFYPLLRLFSFLETQNINQ